MGIAPQERSFSRTCIAIFPAPLTTHLEMKRMYEWTNNQRKQACIPFDYLVPCIRNDKMAHLWQNQKDILNHVHVIHKQIKPCVKVSEVLVQSPGNTMAVKIFADTISKSMLLSKHMVSRSESSGQASLWVDVVFA